MLDFFGYRIFPSRNPEKPVFLSEFLKEYYFPFFNGKAIFFTDLPVLVFEGFIQLFYPGYYLFYFRFHKRLRLYDRLSIFYFNVAIWSPSSSPAITSTMPPSPSSPVWISLFSTVLFLASVKTVTNFLFPSFIITSFGIISTSSF